MTKENMEDVGFTDKAENIAAITATVLITLGIIQIIIGQYYSKSIALVANGIDCIGDGFVSTIVWGGIKVSKRPEDEKFHYGYYKIENIGSIAAAVLMGLMAIYIAYRSYQQYIDPHPIEMATVAITAALMAALAAFILGFLKYRKYKKTKLGSLKLEAENTIKDGTASLLTAAALVLSAQGYPQADAVMGLIISLIILIIGFTAIKEAGYILVDACDGYCIDLKLIVKNIAHNLEQVKKVDEVRLRRTGPVFQGEITIEVPKEMTIQEAEEIKKEIQKQIKKRYPAIERITITPIPYKDK